MATPKIVLHKDDLPAGLSFGDVVAVDTETMGLNPHRDRLCVIQLSAGDGTAHLVQLSGSDKLITFEWGEYRKRAQQGEHTTAQLGWTGDNGDPDNFFFLRGCTGARPGGQNITKWCNKGYDDMLVQARKLTDATERTKLYEKMQVIEKEEAPDLKIAHSIVYETMRKEVEGYKQSPFGSHHFKGVDVK